ncbi:MAG: thymidylate synthase [Patescibacteria group bacterium]
MLITHSVQARDLPDLWFQAVHGILEKGRRFVIDRGSYAGQMRLEYDYFFGHILNPGFGAGTNDILPQIPASVGIPNPVDLAYVYGGEGYSRSYVEYVMTARKELGESYTYGERLTKFPISVNSAVFYFADRNKDILIQDSEIWNTSQIIIREAKQSFLNQIEFVIWVYKNKGFRNNQLVLQVAQPSDLVLQDPPCLRQIDTRIQDGKLHFFVYFRSWDLWGGLPANLAAIQFLKEYMASEIGVEDGEMIVESKGLHLYGYAEDLAKMRCLKT